MRGPRRRLVNIPSSREALESCGQRGGHTSSASLNLPIILRDGHPYVPEVAFIENRWNYVSPIFDKARRAWAYGRARYSYGFGFRACGSGCNTR